MDIDESARTMFARHKLGGDADGVRWLRENKYVAINWEDSPSTDEEDYGADGRSRGYQEVRRMRNVAESDQPTIIGSYYGGKLPERSNELLIGRVDPEADVHIIHYTEGETPEVYPSESAARDANVPDECDDSIRDPRDDEWVYKALPLVGCEVTESPRTIRTMDFPLLSAVQPRHHSFCNWHAASSHLRAIDAGKSSFREVEGAMDDPSDPLAPAQLEVVCSEYLRSTAEYRDFVQLLPAGRTLKDVDIVGQHKQGKVFAQVTKATGDDLDGKAEALGAYEGEGVTRVLFAPESQAGRESIEANVDAFHAVESVVSVIDEDAPAMIDTMYQLPSLEE